MNRKQRRANWRGIYYGRVLRIYGTFARYYEVRKAKAVARRGR